MLESIKSVGAYCRGKKELDREELNNFLAVAIDGLKSVFLRGAAIKTIQKLTRNNVFATLGFTLRVEGFPAIIKVLNNEMTVEKATEEVGTKAFTAGIVTILVILFPPIGTALLTATVLQAIWLEISPEWKKYWFSIAETTLKPASEMKKITGQAIVTETTKVGEMAETTVKDISEMKNITEQTIVTETTKVGESGSNFWGSWQKSF